MKKLVITLLVVLALLVGADFGARAIAESRAGEALAKEAGTTTAPNVDIIGFPFLTQAIGGEYGHITVSLVGTELATLPLSGVLDLYQVHFPLSDAMRGNTSNVTAERATMVARTPVSGLAEAIGKPDLELAAAPGGAVRVSTSVTVGPATFQVAANATVTVSGNTLRVQVAAPQVGGLDVNELPAAVKAAAARALSFDLPLKGMPVKIETATVTVVGTEVVLSATGTDVELNQL